MNPKRIFRLATMGDVPVIMRLIDEARAIMRSCGNVNQWIDGYPSEETIKHDIDNGHCYLCVERDSAVAGNLRIDTHRDNVIMRHVIEHYGFTYCGIIYLLNGDERLAYQKRI